MSGPSTQTSLPVHNGASVCVADTYFAVMERKLRHVVVYDMATRECVARFGDNSQFKFAGFGGMCGATAPTTSLYVADSGNGRVSQHALPHGDRLRNVGVSHLRRPQGVDVNDDFIAVSDWDRDSPQPVFQVMVFRVDTAEDAPPLWTVDGLNYPRGVRLAHTSAAVFIADTGNNRVIWQDFAHALQRVSADDELDGPESESELDDAKVRVVHTYVDTVTVVADRDDGLLAPTDLLECCDGGVIISDTGNHSLVKAGPERDHRYRCSRSCGRSCGRGRCCSGRDHLMIRRLGRRGAGDGEFMCPEGLAYDPRVGVLIRDSGNARLAFADLEF